MKKESASWLIAFGGTAAIFVVNGFHLTPTWSEIVLPIEVFGYLTAIQFWLDWSYGWRKLLDDCGPLLVITFVNFLLIAVWFGYPEWARILSALIFEVLALLVIKFRGRALNNF